MVSPPGAAEGPGEVAATAGSRRHIERDATEALSWATCRGTGSQRGTGWDQTVGDPMDQDGSVGFTLFEAFLDPLDPNLVEATQFFGKKLDCKSNDNWIFTAVGTSSY